MAATSWTAEPSSATTSLVVGSVPATFHCNPEPTRIRMELEQALTKKLILQDELEHSADSHRKLHEQLEEAQRGLKMTQDSFEEARVDLKNERQRWKSVANSAEEEEDTLRAQLEVKQSMLDGLLAARKRFREKQRKLAERPVALARLERRLEQNIAREMCIAREGRVLEKVTERAGKSELRLVALCDDSATLRWGHPPGPLTGKCKSLDLKHVRRIEYGCKTRAAALFQSAPLWLCFALATTDRSYDFICPDEDVAQCFVLSLSRLCADAIGAVPNRRRFWSLRGWSKIWDRCRRKQLSLPQALLLAIEAAAEQPAARPHAESTLYDLPTMFTGRPSLTHSVSAASSDAEFAGLAMVSHTSVRTARASVAQSEDAGTPMAGSEMSLVRSSMPARMAVSHTSSHVDLTYGSGTTQRAWPRPGENWVFTGAVIEVEVYRDAELRVWVNRMKCRGKDGERRMVTILTAKLGSPLIEIRGTDKFRFIRGWIHLIDHRGVWVLEDARNSSSVDKESIAKSQTEIQQRQLSFARTGWLGTAFCVCWGPRH